MPSEAYCFWGGECGVAGKQCGLLPSYTVDSQGRCVKFTECSLSGRSENPKCIAKAQK